MSIFDSFAKLIEVVAPVFQGVAAVRSYQADKAAEKEIKKANAAGMAAAAEEARLAREDAAYKAEQQRKDAAKVRSQQISQYLKSGVTLDGSPMLVTKDTTAQGEENAQNIMKNAESTSRSILLRGKASQQSIKPADFFGTAADVLGSVGKSATAYKNKGKK